jgi:hypothetical protein
MPNPTPMPDEAAAEFLPLRSKAKRTKDAEAIRQDFVKSRGLPMFPEDEKKSLSMPKENE